MKTDDYRLASGVYACVSGGCLVFLDLRRDQYACLDRQNSAAALTLLDSRERKFSDRVENSESPQIRDAMSIVQTLASRGLLQQSATEARMPVPEYIVPTKSFLDSVATTDSPQLTSRHCLAFLRASLAASIELRWFPIHSTVRRVASTGQVPGRVSASSKRLTELVGDFHRLRPYYPRPYLCLFDSLALLQFLSAFGLRPNWIFGVRTEPFNAHCWVQAGSYILNDSVEEVSDYTPIMIV